MRTTMILTWTVGHSYKEETEGTRGVLVSNKPNLNIYIKHCLNSSLDTAHKYIGGTITKVYKPF